MNSQIKLFAVLAVAASVTLGACNSKENKPAASNTQAAPKAVAPVAAPAPKAETAPALSPEFTARLTDILNQAWSETVLKQDFRRLEAKETDLSGAQTQERDEAVAQQLKLISTALLSVKEIPSRASNGVEIGKTAVTLAEVTDLFNRAFAIAYNDGTCKDFVANGQHNCGQAHAPKNTILASLNLALKSVGVVSVNELAVKAAADAAAAELAAKKAADEAQAAKKAEEEKKNQPAVAPQAPVQTVTITK